MADKRILDSLLQVSLTATRSFDPLQQASAALDELVKVMGAERAFAFLWNEETQELKFTCGRAAMGVALPAPTGFSSTVVKKVIELKKPLVVTGSDEMELMGSASALVHDLRSIIATPLILQDKLKGVVYLDSRLAKGLFTHEDAEVLAAIGNHIAIAFETTRLTQIEVQRREFAKDLELTATVQKMFLPEQKLVQNQDFTLSSFYRAAAHCSGDWWWYKLLSNNRLFFIVGDVVGHGAGPAMITAVVASCFRVLEAQERESSLHRLLQTAHNLLLDFAKAEHLMSMLAVEYSAESRSLKMYSLAAPAVIILSKSGEVEFVGERGAHLGSKNFRPGESNAILKPGDRVFVYTDGIIEMVTTKGRQFGDRNLVKLLEQSRDMNAETAIQYVQQKLDEARGSHPQDDDFTFVIFDVN